MSSVDETAAAVKARLRAARHDYEFRTQRRDTPTQVITRDEFVALRLTADPIQAELSWVPASDGRYYWQDIPFVVAVGPPSGGTGVQ